jgi:hypothetical protein
MTQPHSHQEPVQQQAPPQENSWTGYAAVKYGFIFLIVVAILWFLATYVLGIFD